MSGRRTYILVAGETSWSVTDAAEPTRAGAVEVHPSSTAEELAAAAAAALSDMGRRREPVVLALPSCRCLCAGIDSSGLPARGRAQAMLYRLEDRLPLAAEEVVADFVVRGPRAMGVAARVDVLQPILVALESRGVGVRAVAPLALLALSSDQGRLLSDGVDAVAWRSSPGNVDLFLMEDGLPVAWSALPEEAAAVLLPLRVRATALGRPVRVVLVGLDPDVAAAIAGAAETEARRETGPSQAECAAAAAVALARGRGGLLVDLRRGPLASEDVLGAVRGPARAAALAAGLLIAVGSGALLRRAAAYDAQANAAAAAEVDLFRQAFPGSPVPADVRSRLRSEAQLHPRADGDGVTMRGRTVRLLRDALEDMGGGVRLVELRTADDRFSLDADADTRAAADAFGQSLRSDAGLVVEQVGTRRADDGRVALHVEGRAAAGAAAPARTVATP